MELKTPPFSLEAEQAVIGAILFDPSKLSEAELTPDDFYRREHKTLWIAIQAVSDRGQSPDALLVSEYLRDANLFADAGGLDYMSDLLMNTQSASNLRQYAGVVRERFLERRLISIGSSVIEFGYNPMGRPVSDRIDDSRRLIEGLDGIRNDVLAEHLGKYLNSALEDLEVRQQNKGKLLGISTGYDVLDNRCGGLRPDQLTILAGRPGMGKSAISLNIAEYVAINTGLVIVFSLEMPGLEVANRVLCSQARVSNERMKSAGLMDDDWDRLTRIASNLHGKPLYVSENPAVTSAEIPTIVRQISRQVGMPPSLVVIDYLQLMADKGDGAGRVSTISRNLKLAAKSLHCPLIALSQLNRGVEQRPNKRPMMSDLKESGSIEADADQVWMIYRDEVYNDDSEHKGIAEIITRKARGAQVGTDMLASNLNYYRFDNLAQNHSMF